MSSKVNKDENTFIVNIFPLLFVLVPNIFPGRTWILVIFANFSTRPTMFNAYLLQPHSLQDDF